MSIPVFSIIIPTYRRRDTVVETVRALDSQRYDQSFEVIVVVDGSDDGSAEALRSLPVTFPLRIIEQANAGAASARNRGAQAAAGGILLFLDDDMVAHPDMLAQHHASHRSGADAVLGHIPIHPESLDTFLSERLGRWAERRAVRLQSRPELTVNDLLTGQLSISRELFETLGCFDVTFTRNGSFGAEDTDFGWRLLQNAGKIVFNPKAISFQRYVVTFGLHMRQRYEAGQADAALVRKHPEMASAILKARGGLRPLVRFVIRPLVRLPLIGKAAATLAATTACAIAERRPTSPRAFRIFRRARQLVYWRGVTEAGGIHFGRSLRVLAYHSVSPEAGGKLSNYAIDPMAFADQMDLLRRRGFNFVSARQAVAFLNGEGDVPKRAALITFDDGFTNLKDEAVPVLHSRGIPAIVFAVTRMIGRTNEWDRKHEAKPRRLMTRDELAAVRAQGVEIGAHSRHHRSLPRLTPPDLGEEVDGSLADIAELGLSDLRLFCYPYGAVNDIVEERVRSAGTQAAFTVEAGIARAGHNPMRVPRLEVLRSDGCGLRFLWKVATGMSLGRLSR